MIYLLKPILSPRLWGGNALPVMFNVQSRQKIGEAWLLSCIGNNNSPIMGSNENLLDLFTRNPDIVRVGYRGKFPLLIKLIDARDDLSIQVHPNSKTESWYILSETPSKLYLGFRNKTTKAKVKEVLEKGDITTLLNHVEVKEGDTYLINPGTIHAIGKGTFLIEVQRSDDTTYRLFDFNRLDQNGKKRELHIKEGLDAIDYRQLKVTQTRNRNCLVSCPYFKVYKEKVDGQKSFYADKTSFHSITVLNGSGTITHHKESFRIKAYDTIFVPANDGKYTITGHLNLILATL
ncbi:MAG: class I mannose-6-phosphate isomerase [Bacilli bacterium]|nr:class I mannose-6-phosphate isomerase [Bacilli bacterium]